MNKISRNKTKNGPRRLTAVEKGPSADKEPEKLWARDWAELAKHHWLKPLRGDSVITREKLKRFLPKNSAKQVSLHSKASQLCL